MVWHLRGTGYHLTIDQTAWYHIGLLGNNELNTKLPDALLSEIIVVLLLHMALDIFVCSGAKEN